MSSRHSFILPLIVVLAGGCAPVSPAASWTLPNGQSCVAATPPEHRAALSDLLDVEALERALATRLRTPGAAPDTLVILVSYDMAGAANPVRAAGAALSREAAAELQEIVAAHLASSARPRSSATALLIAGSTPRLVPWEPAYECPPLLLNRAVIAQEMERVGRGMPAHTRPAMVHLLVEQDGTVSGTRLERSSGSPSIDAELVRIISAARFIPARLEHHVVPAWVGMPLQIVR